MIMTPLALLLVFVALILWPIIKLAATLRSRPLWRRQKALLMGVLNDRAIDQDQRDMAERAFREGYGSAI